MVKVNDLQFADLLNYARVSASNPDSVPANNEASAITDVQNQADISITKTAKPIAGSAGSAGDLRDRGD